MRTRQRGTRSLFPLAAPALCLAAWAHPASAQCPAGSTAIVIDLVAATVTGSNPNVTVAPFTGPPNARQTVVTIDLTGCTQATISAAYGAAVSGWTLNLGDSPSNDGFGGGAVGSTLRNAELQVLNGTFSLFAASSGASLGSQPGPTPNGTVRLLVRNASLRYAASNIGVLHTAPPQGTFTIPDLTPNVGDGGRFYLGVNRVIRSIGGAPAWNRIGQSVRRVFIAMQ